MKVSSKPIETPMRDRKALRELHDSSDEDSDDGEVHYGEGDEESSNDGDENQEIDELSDSNE